MHLLDLYGALRPLDEITGATTTDDILNLIFSTFCIGKWSDATADQEAGCHAPRCRVIAWLKVQGDVT